MSFRGLNKTFCGSPGYKPVLPGWFKICVLVFNGNTQRLTESGFMEKPGIELATTGLQDLWGYWLGQLSCAGSRGGSFELPSPSLIFKYPMK